jgi:Xaa-Pro aminopeptidase
VRYLSGFSGSSAIMFVSARETLLITDFRYQTQVADEVGELARITIEPQSLWVGVWQQLAQMPGLEVLGFESAHLVHRDFQRLLEAGARYQWRPTVDLVEALRERKDADELCRILEAVETAEHALGLTIAQVRVGMTEMEVAGLRPGRWLLLRHNANLRRRAVERGTTRGPRCGAPGERASCARGPSGNVGTGCRQRSARLHS